MLTRKFPQGCKNTQDASIVAGTVLIIDDDESTSEAIGDMLSHAGFAPRIAATRDEALVILQTACFDAVTMDLRMPGMSAEHFISEVRLSYPSLPLVMISANANVREIARTLGVKYYLHKPFRCVELLEILRLLHVSER